MITHSLPYTPEISTDYFSSLRDLGHPVFLDSCMPNAERGRFDIMSAAPAETFQYSVGERQDPFNALENLITRYTPNNLEPMQDLPFIGGLIGYFGYDLGREIEALKAQTDNDIALPDLIVGVYLWALVVDHKLERATLVATETASKTLIKEVHTRLFHASAEPVEPLVVHPISNAASSTVSNSNSAFSLTSAFEANQTPQDYYQALTKIDDYIHAGDCYQVNYAQRFSAPYTGDLWQAYLLLREIAPTPFAGFFETEHGTLLSLSPECFLTVNQNQVVTKPIKGTCPRGKDEEEDRSLALSLQASTKDRAENLMIVDLLRNDLSKACSLGSVKVPELFALESYRNVHHLVSTVTGTLAPQSSSLGLLKSCFPGGSITGAPKIRAMEIIEELEPHRRSAYCGSMGYVSFCGNMDTSIMIRTLVGTQDTLYCWAGGGIVADSEIEKEYNETYAKVNNLLNTLNATCVKDA